MGKYTDINWDDVGRSNHDRTKRAPRIPQADIDEAMNNPGEWVEIPPRVLTESSSAGTAWTSEVRTEGKPYLPGSPGDWDADRHKIASFEDGRALYGFAIRYLGNG